MQIYKTTISNPLNRKTNHKTTVKLNTPPKSLPDKFISLELPDHQAKPVDS